MQMGPWEYLYFIGTYACLAICVYAAFQRRKDESWGKVFVDLFILALFIVAYWLLESIAHVSAPFYGYPPIFPDMVGYFDWSRFGITTSEPVLRHACMKVVESFPTMSMTIPILETCVTYSVMWTGRLLLTKYNWGHSFQTLAIVPFLAGLVTLLLDGFLDPIVSQSFSCTVPVVLHHEGLGYWRWFANEDLANVWFGIPAFNYAAWYAAPVLLITFVLFFRWARDLLDYWRGESDEKPSFTHGLRLLCVMLAALVLHVTAPDHEPPVIQIVTMIVAILVSLAVVLKHRGQYVRNHAFRWEFVVPQVFFFSLPVFQLFLTGTFKGIMWPVLLPITIVFAITGIWFAFTPYTGKQVSESES